MKAFKLFFKIFAVFSSIFVVGFFTYNLWDDYVRTGFSESPGYEWVANKMPEYEENDLVDSNPTETTNDISDIEAEIEREMAEKERADSIANNSLDTDDTENQGSENQEFNDEEDPENNNTETAENNTKEEESESKEDTDSELTKTENNTSNCFNIVDGGMTCPKPDEIIYIEAESGKATIYLKERKKYFVAHAIEKVYDQFGKQNVFFKTEKYLINLQHLHGFIPKGQANSSNRKIDLELIDSKEISIPYSHLDQLQEQYIEVRGINK